MIKLIDDDFSKIEYLNTDNPFSARIISQLRSYNPNYSFVDYRLIYDEENTINGIISRYGTVFTVYLENSSSVSELSRFLPLMGAKKILIDGRFTLDFQYTSLNQGSVLRRNRDYFSGYEGFKFIRPDIKDYYRLLLQNTYDDFSVPEFDDFYVDLNHRLRHGLSRAYGLYVNDKLIAGFMSEAETETSAVLGGLVCDKAYRNKGIGTALLKFITDDLIKEGKTVYLNRALNKNQSFYEKACFTECGSWKEYYI